MFKKRSKGKDNIKALLICLARLFAQPKAEFTLIYSHTIAKPKRYSTCEKQQTLQPRSIRETAFLFNGIF